MSAKTEIEARELLADDIDWLHVLMGLQTFSADLAQERFKRIIAALAQRDEYQLAYEEAEKAREGNYILDSRNTFG